MENATKALIMAGTVLISLLLISLAVYLFSNYSDFATKTQEKQAIQEKIQFNTRFEKYVEKDLTLQDVVTIANLAREFNEKYEDSKIKIYINNRLYNDNYDWTEELKEATDNNLKTLYIIKNYNDIKYDDNRIIEKIYIKTK